MSNAKYREVKRVAEVGEKIKVVNASPAGGTYVNGDVMSVVKSKAYTVHVDRKWLNAPESHASLWHWEYVVLENIVEPSALTTQPLFEAFTQFIRSNADAVRALLDENIAETPVFASLVKSELRTPKKLTRAQVIELSKADVAELVWIGKNHEARLPEGTPLHHTFYVVKFEINREKHAVACVVFKSNSRGEYKAKVSTGVAKCAPNDVFHAEIGKAIAIRRALGLLIPEEYTEAPKPKELRLGAIVENVSEWRLGTTGEVTGFDYTGVLYKNEKATRTDGAIWDFRDNVKIIDDTDVDYNVIEAEGVAA